MTTKHTDGPWWEAANPYGYGVGSGDRELLMTLPHDDPKVVRAALLGRI